MTFQFADGTAVQYFGNITVGVPPPGATYTHWETSLDPLPQQNVDNTAYNLDSMGSQVVGTTTYLFEGNPAGDAQSTVAGNMVAAFGTASDVFALQPPVPAPGQETFTQNPGGSQQASVSVSRLSPPQPIADAPGHYYTYQAVVREPLTVRSGSTYYLQVGSYVLDNGFSGHIYDTGGHISGTAINLGEGKAFRFYTNPGVPTGRNDNPADPSSTLVSWAPVPPTSYDPATTRVTYELIVPLMGGRSFDVTGLTGTQQQLELAVGRYVATVQATFTFPDGSRIRSDKIGGTFFVGAAAPPTPTPAPATATPLPPTATPTPALAEGVISSTAPAYAWLSDPGLPATVPDGTLATTRHAADPTGFAWPAGRPLRLLPALSDHTDLLHLTLHDDGNGADTVIVPSSVSSQSYSIDGGPCGDQTLSGGGTYAHAPSTPSEVATQDASGTILPGAMTLLWLPAPAAGQRDPAVTECDLSAYLRQMPGGVMPAADLPLTYTVTQRVQFTVLFGATVPVTGGQTTICPLVAAPPPIASSSAGTAFDDGGYVPQNGVCPAGDVGLMAVENALTQGTLHGLGGASFSIVPAPGGLPFTTTPAPGGATTMQVTLLLRRQVALHYHLVLLREVGP